MKHRYHKPNKLLTEYVRTVLIVEGFSESPSDTLPAFTQGMPALLCRTEKDPAGHENILQLTLFGKSIPDDSWTIGKSTTIIAYFFKPFVLAGLFKIAAKELSKTPVDLGNWSPHKFNALRMQLIYAASTPGKIETLDHLLIQQQIENQKLCEIIRFATDRIMYHSEKEVISEIRKELKLNERTFQRIFKKYVGVTPTQYRRICQFQFSFGQLRSKQFSKISDVAFDNGFADHSHFIRSFKEFTDTTPNDYLQKGLPKKKP